MIEITLLVLLFAITWIYVIFIKSSIDSAFEKNFQYIENIEKSINELRLMNNRLDAAILDEKTKAFENGYQKGLNTRFEREPSRDEMNEFAWFVDKHKANYSDFEVALNGDLILNDIILKYCITFEYQLETK